MQENTQKTSQNNITQNPLIANIQYSSTQNQISAAKIRLNSWKDNIFNKIPIQNQDEFNQNFDNLENILNKILHQQNKSEKILPEVQLVHRTSPQNIQSIMINGLRASPNPKNPPQMAIKFTELQIFLSDMDDNKNLNIEDEVSIMIDVKKAINDGMNFHFDQKTRTWMTSGFDGIIPREYFISVVEHINQSKIKQEQFNNSNIDNSNQITQDVPKLIYQSVDDPKLEESPFQVLQHGSYWENLYGITQSGLKPSERRDSYVHAFPAGKKLLINSQGCGVTFVPGMYRNPDFIVEFESKDAKINKLIPNTILHKGTVQTNQIKEVKPIYPDWLPKELQAKIVNPRDFGLQIPIIDLSLPKQQVIEKLKWACESVGFMQVINHGVDVQLMDDVLEYSKKLFDLSFEEKEKLAPKIEGSLRGYFKRGSENLNGVVASKGNNDQLKQIMDLKELYDMKGHNSIQGSTFKYAHCFDTPAKEPPIEGFLETVQKYQAQVFEVACRLLRLMTNILGCQEDFFEKGLKNPVTTHRLLHYWPQSCDFENNIGIGAHTDYGMITLLFQDMIGGLQVLNAITQEWIVCPPIHGAFVVNIGDMLARFSGYRFKSTIHRVVNTSNRHRYSSPFFLEPSFDTLIDAKQIPTRENNEQNLREDDEPITCEDLLVQFYKSSGQLKEINGENSQKKN